MTRLRATGLLVFLLLGGAVVFAQEQQQLANVIFTRQMILGAGVSFQMEGSTADAFEFKIVVEPTADIVWTLPATQGAAGTQLQTTAGGDLSWASAGSQSAYKTLDGKLDPQVALKTLMGTPIHLFHYKPNAPTAVTTQDFATQYAGPVAEEAPWAMHHGGTILNPVNAIGYTTAAIQAQQAQIDALKAEIAALKAGR